MAVGIVHTRCKTNRFGLTEERMFTETHRSPSHVIFRRGWGGGRCIECNNGCSCTCTITRFLEKIAVLERRTDCCGVASVTPECEALSNMAGMQVPFWLLRKEKLQKYAY